MMPSLGLIQEIEFIDLEEYSIQEKIIKVA